MNANRFGRAASTLLLAMLPGLLFAQAGKPAAADAPAAAQSAPAADAGKIIGYRLTQRPVASTRQAREYAGEWLTAGYLTDLAVGAVNRIGGLYVVDLVTAEKPRKRVNQLLIRKRDGFGVLVYPGAPKQAVAEPMVGMAGLEGMSGMSGLKTIQARVSAHGTVKTRTVRQAKRLIDAWLIFNSLPDLYAGATRDLGGIFVTRIVDEAGRPKNQAVMRKTDGYIQLTDPVSRLGTAKP